MKKWTEEKIIQKIQQMDKRNLSLNEKFIQKNYPILYRSACQYFDSWQHAVQAAGYNYRKHR